MGAKIEIQNQREEALELIADIYVESSSLKGVEIEGEQIPKMIDEFPIICVAASLAEGKTRIKGASELRFKESDRIKTMSKELRKLGGNVQEFDDGVEIVGVEKFKGGTCNSHGDHRVAMSLLVAGLNAKEETIVEDTGSINRLYLKPKSGTYQFEPLSIAATLYKIYGIENPEILTNNNRAVEQLFT